MRIRSRNNGFSLIELLTVIAIIAILAAIIFPVMNNVKQEANKAKCMTNMKSISSAIKMYKLDNRKYPERIGPIYDPAKGFDYFASHRTPNCIMGEQIKAVAGFRCPTSKRNNYAEAMDVVDPYGSPVIDRVSQQVIQFYAVDDYDMSVKPGTAAGEQRYALQWAEAPNGARGVDRLVSNGNNEGDDFERQLFRKNAPENSVVTWCSNHNSGEKDVVLFLDGMARAMDHKTVDECKWRIKPPQL